MGCRLSLFYRARTFSKQDNAGWAGLWPRDSQATSAHRITDARKWRHLQRWHRERLPGISFRRPRNDCSCRPARVAGGLKTSAALSGLGNLLDGFPRASLADSLCPGLLSFGLSALAHAPGGGRNSSPNFFAIAITHRQDAVYPATIVGIPPMEDFYIGGASMKLFLPIFKMNFPEIVDIALPAEGVFHNLVFVSIKKTYPMQAYKIMHGLWGMGQMMFTKYIVVVDAGVNVHNTSEVLFHLTANTDPQR